MRSARFSDSRFLIVDHYPFLRDIMRRTLVSLGAAHVDTVASASTALDRCREHHYDFVVAEYELGDGKNGQQMLEEMRNEGVLRNTSGFMMVTSETARDVVLSTLEHQPDDYLAKPYPQHLLERRVRRLLRLKAQLQPVFAAIDAQDRHKAIREARAYLSGDPEFRGNAVRILGQLCLETGQLDAAEAIHAHELAENNADWARMGLARVYLEQERYPEAEPLLLGLIASNNLYVEAYEQLARLYLALDAPQRAEEIMARGVQVSPLSVHRQQFLAHLCERNGHLERAASAWRDIIRITRHSRHEGAEGHLCLARVLTDHCEMMPGWDKGDSEEALRQLELLRVRYRPWGDTRLQSLLIESRLHFGQGETDPARSCLQEAGRMIAEAPDHLLPGSLLEYAKSLLKAGEPDRAGAVLEELAQRDDAGTDVLALADRLVDDPVSPAGKRAIIALNRAGIRHFHQARYDQAAETFRRALARFPRNVELNLNLMQSLLLASAEDPETDQARERLDAADHCGRRLGRLPESHPRYRHYLRLRQEIEARRTASDTSPD